MQYLFTFWKCFYEKFLDTIITLEICYKSGQTYPSFWTELYKAQKQSAIEDFDIFKSSNVHV